MLQSANKLSYLKQLGPLCILRNITSILVQDSAGSVKPYDHLYEIGIFETIQLCANYYGVFHLASILTYVEIADNVTFVIRICTINHITEPE